jgi:hypothetical protein
MKSSSRSLRVLLLTLLCALPLISQDFEYKPKNGFIPDEKTAIAVAEAVLSAVYGEEQIAQERPFSAKLTAGVWVVVGSSSSSSPNGGVAEIKISKQTGRIFGVTHGK